MIDAIDKKILNIIQDNARITNKELAEKLEMAPSAILERMRKLEKKGIIDKYLTKLDENKLGIKLGAFILVKTNEKAGNCCVASKLAEIPDVQEVHHVAGEDCYVVKIKVTDTDSLSRIMRDQIGQIDPIVSTKTLIILDTTKESISINLAV